ncbi:geranylgeranyl reductase family protein [Corynebacterium breve]|uniref:Geranylgeranyl reductase family protein n=1 Tax=Corynebacterium breve TaxID=3049799 RepID=A0ABY8VJM0_9CORY|nr:geranylgeranyl reductase family protein [Corynebacterium breve]WIM68980.1 geranylgeranyl reductase family protein [Corynebacterium breve]
MGLVSMNFECVVVGAGPSGAAAALAAARRGLDVVLLDGATFPRDKTCGDGLTPRGVHALRQLGIIDVLPEYRNNGLKLHGYGGSVTAPWPDGHYGQEGSAMPRELFDDALVHQARTAGAQVWEGCPATDVEFTDGRITGIVTPQGVIRPKWVIVADGVRSPFGKLLGRTWHKGEVYGIAARSYCASPLSDEPWMHSHVELRDSEGEIQPGYGWIFPLGNGEVNLGCGALSTSDRPAKINTKKLLSQYAEHVREEWDLGPEQRVTSAMLPMGGAVSNVAGANWMLIGDAAACVNPLNGEGIDYGLETAQMAVNRLGTESDFTLTWPFALREAYGEAFVLARTAARLLTYPKFLPLAGPVALRGPVGAALMPAAARLMGNLITDEDRDLIARTWRTAGKAVSAFRRDTPLWSVE